MTRQKFVGWILIVVSTAYLVYFLKVRLFTPGPFIARGEWFQVIGCIATLMIGTINIRMAARAEAKHNEAKRDVRR
ncbi:hypothetical protein RA307_18080 [Xanthobacteraceae bacterium Astr-EGSB]|uniref:hypothetical protein n=1 Tax=Astrobacterium formosum TaxID=3069710 RepID=UPI0027B2D2C1|nr:hypothetical protein [Xanthobacteraceae bacterium Astr-EGSB]